MSLDAFFEPKTVAVIGASREEKKIGHIILWNFVHGFKGKVFPVNPKADEILGLKCYGSVSAIKEQIDLAVIALPAPFVPDVVEECGKAKVKAVLIVSGGFKETGHVDLEKRLTVAADKYRMRIIGPNGLGVYDPYSGVDTIFNPREKLQRPGKGVIGFASQSGATMSVILDWMAMKDYKISKAISYGNMADVDESELVEFLDSDKKTKVICLYLEGVSNGRKFFATLKKTKKPVVVLKGGITEAGKKAATSHTGSLAGEAAVYSAAIKQAGTVEAKDIEQLFDFARVLSAEPKPKGDRVQIITDGGGFGVLTSDYIVRCGLRVSQLSEQNKQKLRKIVPPHANVENMIDLTGDATKEMYKTSLETSLQDTNVDMVALILLPQPPMISPDIVDVITEVFAKTSKPIIVICSGGAYTENLKKNMEEKGVPTFGYPERAIEAARALYEYTKNKNI
jgi:acetyl coenzyme A synthetase (ADP forming)-like protein